MRHLQRLPLLLISTALLALTAHAQPTWRFHLAFEDGSGARDTLWFIYDTSATTGSVGNPVVDYDLGEGAVEMLPGTFNVFLKNWDFDSTKTIAWPYTWYPYFETGHIEAINWVPPMTLRWDTSLFHAPYLPYEQGSFGLAIMIGMGFIDVNNGDGTALYHLLLDDSVTVSQFWDYLFPFSVLFGPVNGLGLSSGQLLTVLHPWPNPAGASVYLGNVGMHTSVRIMDMAGRVVREMANHPATVPIDVGHLPAGSYTVRAITTDGMLHQGKFIKG